MTVFDTKDIIIMGLMVVSAVLGMLWEFERGKRTKAEELAAAHDKSLRGLFREALETLKASTLEEKNQAEVARSQAEIELENLRNELRVAGSSIEEPEDPEGLGAITTPDGRTLMLGGS